MCQLTSCQNWREGHESETEECETGYKVIAWERVYFQQYRRILKDERVNWGGCFEGGVII